MITFFKSYRDVAFVGEMLQNLALCLTHTIFEPWICKQVTPAVIRLFFIRPYPTFEFALYNKQMIPRTYSNPDSRGTYMNDILYGQTCCCRDFKIRISPGYFKDESSAFVPFTESYMFKSQLYIFSSIKHLWFFRLAHCDGVYDDIFSLT